MKVLYIGVWKDGTGWGNAAQNYIMALDQVGVDVVPRAVRLNTRTDTHIPERILELEQNDEQGADVCIQHILPDMMDYNGHFDMNIGAFAAETSHFRNTNWAEKLNTMDQVWVFNSQMRNACERSYVYKPVAVVPHCFDISRYCQPSRPYPLPDIDGKFVFYTILEVTRRKNLVGLLKAFHLEFSPNEPVALLIKGHVPGQSPAESGRILKSMIAEVKSGLRLYPSHEDYLNEILVTQWLSDDEMLRIHNTGDCFVLPSYGEAWGIPGFEAMASGTPVILTDEGGPGDYVISGESGLLLPSRLEPVFMRPEEVPTRDIWVGNEDWSAPDLQALRRNIRSVYQCEKFRDRLSGNGIDRACEYSWENVGGQMKALLDGEDLPLNLNAYRPGHAQARQDKHDLSFLGK